MASKVRIDLSIPVSEATFKGRTRLISTDSRRSFNALSSYMAAIAGDPYVANCKVITGAVTATGTLTITSTGPTATQTFSVANVTFTAETSGATGNQFNINASPTIVAANIAAAVNASPNTAGIVKAASALGVVTFTSLAPGAIGNGLQLSAGTLSNTVASAFASGADGTTFKFDNGYTA